MINVVLWCTTEASLNLLFCERIISTLTNLNDDIWVIFWFQKMALRIFKKLIFIELVIANEVNLSCLIIVLKMILLKLGVFQLVFGACVHFKSFYFLHLLQLTITILIKWNVIIIKLKCQKWLYLSIGVCFLKMIPDHELHTIDLIQSNFWVACKLALQTKWKLNRWDVWLLVIEPSLQVDEGARY